MYLNAVQPICAFVFLISKKQVLNTAQLNLVHTTIQNFEIHQMKKLQYYIGEKTWISKYLSVLRNM